MVMKGYWKQPEATVEALRNGWMHTGDAGYMDKDGYIYLVDRTKDMIVSVTAAVRLKARSVTMGWPST
jgi:long-subunit acyl-CoA synthetase (AMP-forming)